MHEALHANGREAACANLYELLQRQALQHGGRIAFAQARDREASGRYLYATMTYAQLLAEVDQTAAGLARSGIDLGCKTLLLVRPGLELPVIVFALFKLGAVPVIIVPVGLAGLATMSPSSFPTSASSWGVG